MKRTVSGFYALIVTAAIATCSLSACKKDSSTPGGGGGSSSGLSSGQASIQFNTSAAFGGKTEFKSNQPAQSKVVKAPQGTKTNITFNAVQMDGTKLSTAMLTVIIPQDASSGIAGKFDEGHKGDAYAVLLIGSSEAGSNLQSFASSTGNFTVTKLTDTEIEGTFDTYCENTTTKTNITLSNGKFAGKF